MKDHTTTPTAELLSEWERLKDRKVSLEGFVRGYGFAHDKANLAHVERMLPLVAAELDRRCDEAGLSIIPDKVIFTKGMFAVFSFCVAITPIELRDLLSWLILKGGNG